MAAKGSSKGGGTMKAAICRRYGPPEVLEVGQWPTPRPRAHEARVQVYAASVTNSDLFIRGSAIPLRFKIAMRLMLGIRRPRNPILGEVFAGTIDEVGSEAHRFRPGDEVFGLTGFSLGAYAEYLCLPEKDSKRGCLAPKPKSLDFEAATSAAYGGLLAFQFLEAGGVADARRVLVYGASGTTGTIAIQYAKHLGAEVTAVCGPAHGDLVRDLGADHVLDYTTPESLSRLTTYDLVFDAVGKQRSSPLKEAANRALARGGRAASIDDAALVPDSERLEKVANLVDRGAIRPVTDRVYSLEEIVEAHRYVELGHKTGNVAIRVRSHP